MSPDLAFVDILFCAQHICAVRQRADQICQEMLDKGLYVLLRVCVCVCVCGGHCMNRQIGQRLPKKQLPKSSMKCCAGGVQDGQ